ncbi:MAG TPA: DegT/DnrJ/EryC1/StrS aminotransferase family protein [Burkholderiales bacterium]|nr:DegT/DnrJ/EryC1/StrS aminotransferase family protein [Burkholderiales bacterium]
MSFLPFTRPTIDEETIQGVVEVLRSGWITTGPRVGELEKALSEYLLGRPVRTLTSATAALEIGLRICNIGPGHEVITPALSFTATPNVIMRVGAKPVFVDVDLHTRNMSLEQAQAAITSRTRALMPVHFAGLPIDMDALYTLAKTHGLRVIEDAAHAIGSAWHGKKIGSFGDVVSFSFHANKNMTTIEGGALAVASEDDARQIELHRFHGLKTGAPGEMDVLIAGGKANLTDVAARVGLGQLKRLDAFNQKRRMLAMHYFERMSTDPPLALPARGDEGHSWHMFAPLLPLDELRINRVQFIAAMRERDIGVGVHYPAMHLFSLYRELGYRPGYFPASEQIGRRTVTLPLFPAMGTADVDRVCEATATILRENRA